MRGAIPLFACNTSPSPTLPPHLPRLAQRLDEIFEVFARYVEGAVPLLPWCEAGLQLESGPIKSQLARLNRSGLLTINSQPAVNGAKSSDPVYGWGPSSKGYNGGAEGFVYQKATPLTLHSRRTHPSPSPPFS